MCWNAGTVHIAFGQFLALRYFLCGSLAENVVSCKSLFLQQSDRANASAGSIINVHCVSVCVCMCEKRVFVCVCLCV